MRKGAPLPADPDAYVASLSGWQQRRVEDLRTAVRQLEGIDEVVKWGHLVYLTNGPAVLIRAEEARVLVGFWRGQRLRHIEPRLKPGGKYEMATLVLSEDSQVDPAAIAALGREAARLNEMLGDPAKAAPRR